MTAPEDFLRPQNKHAAEIRARLAAFRLRARTYLTARGLLAIVWPILLVAAGSFAVDRLLRLGTTARFVVLVVALIALIRLLWRHLAPALGGDWNELDLSAAVDRGASDAGDTRAFITQRLATLTERAHPERPRRADESPAFVEEALRRSREELRSFPLEDRLDHASFRRRSVLLAVLVLAPILLLSFSETAQLWAKRWFLLSEERWPQETYLVVRGAESGTLIVPRMESVELAVYAKEGSVVPKRVEIEYEVDEGPRVQDVMARFADNDFRIRLPGARREMLVWLKGNDDRRGPIRLVARDRPRVLRFDLEATLEQDGSIESLSFERQDRELSFRRDTRMRLVLTASEPLRALEFSSGSEGLEIEENAATRRTLRWRHAARRALTLELVGDETGLRSRPVSLDLGLREDQAPRLSLEVEGVRDRITPRAMVPTKVLARDDFGLRDVTLDLRLFRPGDEERLPTSLLLAEFEKKAEQRSFERERTVSLEELGAKIGQKLELKATARDHGHLGSQPGAARPRVLRVVSPEELFREIALRLQRARARFRTAKNDADATETMIRRDEDVMTRGAELLRRHRILERQVWAADRTLDATVRELSLNRLIEKEAEAILERAVLEPLARLQERQLPELRAGFASLAAEDPEAPEREVLLAGQEAVGRTMQRVLDGLKQWDSFIDLVNQLDEVIKVQDGVRDDTVREKEEGDDDDDE